MLLAVVAAITMAGLVWLWPTERVLPEGSVLTTEGIVPGRGQITAIEPCPAAPDAPPPGSGPALPGTVAEFPPGWSDRASSSVVRAAR